jgi:arylsulfatase A-like enzyme
MDQEIGRILAQLDAMRARENTLICFLSDNGASAEIMVRGDGHDPAAAPGSAGSYLCLGPGWSTAANTPFRRHKTWVHEGGISTPLVVSWPAGISARGELRHTPGHIVDILPTVLEVARTSASEPESAPPRPGLILVPLFTEDIARPDRELWWLHEGNRAFRLGDWKIVASGRQAPWELYDLSTDRTELHNLAEQHPDKVQTLADKWGAFTSEIRQQVLGRNKVKN